jgi:hypothetical protein
MKIEGADGENRKGEGIETAYRHQRNKSAGANQQPKATIGENQKNRRNRRGAWAKASGRRRNGRWAAKMKAKSENKKHLISKTGEMAKAKAKLAKSLACNQPIFEEKNARRGESDVKKMKA